MLEAAAASDFGSQIAQRLVNWQSCILHDFGKVNSCSDGSLLDQPASSASLRFPRSFLLFGEVFYIVFEDEESGPVWTGNADEAVVVVLNIASNFFATLQFDNNWRFLFNQVDKITYFQTGLI
jgi:hypothetical protein